MKLRKIAPLAAIVALGVTGCTSQLEDFVSELDLTELFPQSEESQSEITQSATILEEIPLEWDQELSPDYYLVTGEAVVEFDLEPGEYEYCDLDSLGRSSCAVASITQADRLEAQERGRESIGSLKPSGWGNNFETVIPTANPNIPKDYRGWFWNRSHMMADSLGGAPIVENVVTGTRPQNVGNNDNNGGMAYTENIARAYLDSPEAESCPLYYAVTAQYQGEELVPRTTMINIQSCDKNIDEQVIVYNVAKDFEIDYYTGEAWPR